MSMEFKIQLEDLTREQTPPTSAASSFVPRQHPASAAQRSSVPIPQLQSIQQTLLPAIASAAPALARELNSIAGKGVSPVSQSQGLGFKEAFNIGSGFLDSFVRSLLDRFEQGKGPAVPAPLENLLHKAFQEGTARTFDELKEIARNHLNNSPPAPTITPMAPARRDNADLDEAFGIPRAAPPAPMPPVSAHSSNGDVFAEQLGRAAGEALADEILPPLEALTIQGREEGEILPPLEELGVRREAPTEIAARAQHERYKQAKFISYTDDTEAPPMRVAQAAEGAEAAETGGALAELGGAAAAAAPVIAAVAAVDLTAKGIAQAFDTARHSVKFFGEEMQAVAGNDYIGAFTHSVDFAADSLKAIPVVGQVVSAELKLVSESIRTFEGVVESFIDRGKELAKFSPELTVANTMADMRSLIADIHEADVLGPELARLTDNWSEFMTELREILLPIKQVIVRTLGDTTEWLKDRLPQIIEALVSIGEVVAQMLNLVLTIVPGAGGLGDSLVSLMKDIHRAIGDLKKKQEEDDKPLDFVKGLFDIQPPDAIGPDAARQAAGNNPLLLDGILGINVPL